MRSTGDENLGSSFSSAFVTRGSPSALLLSGSSEGVRNRAAEATSDELVHAGGVAADKCSMKD
jgi:hypothetical protein